MARSAASSNEASRPKPTLGRNFETQQPKAPSTIADDTLNLSDDIKGFPPPTPWEQLKEYFISFVFFVLIVVLPLLGMYSCVTR